MEKNKKTKGLPKDPVVGSEIYVESRLHISRGSDDYSGGLATITSAHYGMSGGKMEWFIDVNNGEQSYNYAMLTEKGVQERLKKQFGKEKAHPDPDIDTPWIEDGDMVDGKVYHGPDIW